MSLKSKISLRRLASASILLTLSFLFSGIVYAQTVSTEPPKLNISIPGLELTGPRLKDGFLEIPFIAQYVGGIYEYLVGLAVVAAAIMIVYGGFRYIVGSGVGDAQAGKTVIQDAVVGLVLVLMAFLILNTLNEGLTNLKGIRIEPIAGDYKYLFDSGEGTGTPGLSDDNLKKQSTSNVPGTPGMTKTTPPTAPGKAAKTPTVPEPSSTPGQIPTYPPVPDEDVERVDTSIIETKIKEIEKAGKEKKLGAAELINFYCTPRSEAGSAGTYEDKIKLLAKAVMGFYQVCVEKKLCAYCQTCSTVIPTGEIYPAKPSATFAINFLSDHGLMSVSTLWNDIDCITRFEKRGMYSYDNNKAPALALLNEKPSCLTAPTESYNRLYVDKLVSEKFFGGDCGSFTRAVYKCAGAKFKETPQEKYGKQSTAYLSSRSLNLVQDDPMVILASSMDKDLNGLAAQKGGLKFGDLVYTCCGGPPGTYSSHWALYTGGRPDVPFSFIEMGGSQSPPGKGGSITVPGIGAVGGVVIRPKGWNIQDYINQFIKPQMGWGAKGRVLLPSNRNPKQALVYVFRPYINE